MHLPDTSNLPATIDSIVSGSFTVDTDDGLLASLSRKYYSEGSQRK